MPAEGCNPERPARSREKNIKQRRIFLASKVIIIGAAGRDFHNFNVHFRDNDAYEVVAFTATQIPDIEGRNMPRQSLQGKLYPQRDSHPC